VESAPTGGEPIRQWYALRSKPKREEAAAALLERAGIETYLPRVRVQKRAYQPPVVEPLFPGYLFGRLNPTAGDLRLANYTPGVLCVVSFGEQPCPVPDSVIDYIQQRINRGRGRVNGPDYRKGDIVAITSGPLRDTEAVFDCRLTPAGRARVLVQILQRLCRAEVHTDQLRLVKKAAGVA
jgi:transcriptional antiterminator RfaH